MGEGVWILLSPSPLFLLFLSYFKFFFLLFFMIGLTESNPNGRGVLIPSGKYDLAIGGHVELFDKAVGGQKNLQYCRIQVIGTKPVKVCLNDVATNLKYNYTLAADTAAEAGNGGVCEIPGSWDISKVSVFAPEATQICYTIIVNPNGGNDRIVN